MSSINIVAEDDNTIHILQPRHLPQWLWLVIAKSLGIKLNENEKPIIGTIFYVSTLASSLGLILTTWWFTAYDIMSDYTKTTVVDGSISIVYNILLGAFGIYANNLAFRLYSHPHFSKLLKLHSKTILKINAAVILFLLMTFFFLINVVNGFSSFVNKTCDTVGLEVIVCKLRYIFRIFFSVFTLLWNYLVAFAVTSICRSHVIKIRKFMQVLERDSMTFEARFLGINAKSFQEAPLQEYSWVEDNYLDELKDGEESHFQDESLANSLVVGASSATESTYDTPEEFRIVLNDMPPSLTTTKKKTVEPAMSNDEILFNYWKIQSDLRISSIVLQRWMMSLISLVAIWLAMNLVLWLNHDPDLIDLVNFFLPLLLLPLLSSAYAEVNQEGQRLLKYICLIESRVQLLLLLQYYPLQMTVYSFSLSYSTIGTASFGVLLALASKILLQEVFGK